ncbi:MAG: RNase adapter RapZ [Alphaproteobacteria bacterium]|nr:RNase adapter RapZ [Alphaproteobacteria bacterium]MCW5741439.1 RNase adapter RapZ [Alphaproteobacteria bacterium]
MVTGLSGAGRNTALNALEDHGYIAVDNLPLFLVDDLLRPGTGDAQPLVLGIDVRSRGFTTPAVVDHVRDLRARADLDVRLLYLDCDNDVLLRRFTETRRAHPLAQERPVLDGIVDERRLLRPLRDHADVTIDTSQLAPHELKALMLGHFAPRAGGGGLRIAVMSFSYRRGLPREADLVLDTRFLRNPHYVDGLRPLTGQDGGVARYVKADRDFKGFFRGITSLLEPLLPRFDSEGKSYLTVAVGCTGGRHRSVLVAEELAAWLRRRGRVVTLTHRDLEAGAARTVAGTGRTG